MKIRRVEAIPYAIPYRKPLRFASGEVATAEHVLVRVHTDDGVVGTADAPPAPFTYGETQVSVRSIVADHFGPSSPASASSSARSSCPPGAHGRQPRGQGGRRHGHLGHHRPDPRRLRERAPGRVHRPDARLAHGRLRTGRGDGRRGRADARRARDHDVQGEGRTPALPRRRQGLPRPARALGPDIELYIDGNRGWTASESLAPSGRWGPRPLVRRGALPRRRRARPALARPAVDHPDVCRRERLPTGRTSPASCSAAPRPASASRPHGPGSPPASGSSACARGWASRSTSGTRSTPRSGPCAPPRSAPPTSSPPAGRPSCPTTST